MHTKSPWLPMWWSAALPGLGHLSQGMYFKGLILLLWEILVNFKANLNLAIFYTFNGQFAKAAATINSEWVLLYGALFSFAIYDSYRTGVELNILARIEKNQPRRYYKLTHFNATGINFLYRNNPWVALAWSALFTGFGHLYNNKAFKAFILVAWAAAIINYAHINECIIATFNGNFQQSREVIDYQWLLFFPSIYTYAIWDAYTNAVETNKLFAAAQKDYLKQTYGVEEGG